MKVEKDFVYCLEVFFFIFILASGLSYFFFYNDISIKQVPEDSLSAEAKKVTKRLARESTEDLACFEIKSKENQLVQTHLVQRRVFSENAETDYAHEISFPADKSELKYPSFQTKVLIVFSSKNNSFNTLITNSEFVSSTHEMTTDMEKQNNVFIPLDSPIKNDSKVLGYSVYSDSEKRISAMKRNPHRIKKISNEDDYVYEYKVNVEIVDNDS